MNKRSAMSIAAGLVFALMVGAAAVAMGATGPDPTGGADEAQVAQQPHVRTITRTVEVRRGSDAAHAVATDAPGQASYDDDRSDDHGDDEDDDGWDDHGGDADDDRWDDHGGEDDDDHGVDD